MPVELINLDWLQTHIEHRATATNVTATIALSTFCSLHAVTSSVIYYNTQARKNVIYLLNKYIYIYIYIYL